MFKDFKTSYQQNTFFKKHFNMLEVEKTFMGSYYKWKVKNGKKVAVTEKAYAYKIPFLKSLERLLNNNEVMEDVSNPHSSQDGIMRDICDGSTYINHPILGQDEKSLGFIAYCDDVETSNPLGSKAGFHKVCVFYWMLVNIHPAYRSRLRTIQLLAIAKTKYVRKFGPEALLRDFIDGLKKLEHGHEFNIHGKIQSFKGALIAFPADTLASNFMGGFKESPSFALKPCRLCLVKRDDLGEVICESLLRNIEEHKEQVKIVENIEISSKARTYWSKQFGIVRSSVLDTIPHFDVTKGMVLDTMHVLFQGVLAVEIRQFLIYCVVTKKYFTLELFNNRLSSFIGLDNCSEKPAPIEKKAFGLHGNIKQKAAAMWELGIILPFLIEDLVPDGDEHLENYILLCKIVNMCTAFSVNEKDAMLLSRLCAAYARKFLLLYPQCNATPKLHYLQHLGWQILLYGPLRYVSCFRFEGKHATLKTVALTNRNFKNIPFTLAKRHEGLMTLNLLNLPSNDISNFLYAGDEVGKGNLENVCNFIFGNLLISLNLCSPTDNILVAEHLAVHGRIYKKGSVVLLDAGDNFDYLPEFGEVKSMVILEGSKILIIEKKKTSHFNDKLNAYALLDNFLAGDQFIVNVNDLKFPFPVFATIYKTIMYVVAKNYTITEF